MFTANDYYSYCETVVKSDTVNFSHGPCDALYVGGAGIVVAVLQDGTKPQFTAVAGEIIPVRMVRVDSTTTTATLMVALYAI